jgi:hypothetical protein
MSIPLWHLYAVARSWIGTPVTGGGKIKGQSCNCITFAASVAQECGLEELWKVFEPYEGLREEPEKLFLIRAMRRALIWPVTEPLGGGQILMIKNSETPQHVALATSRKSLIQARVTKVAETGLGGQIIIDRFKIPGVDYGG